MKPPTSTDSGRRRPHPTDAARKLKSRILLLVCIVMVAALGRLAADWRGRNADAEERERLLRQAVQIAETISPQLVARLSFTRADQGAPAFQRLREQMIAYGRVIRQRSIYSMAVREGAIIFGPENLAEDDPQASPPGTPYQEPPPQVREVFQGRKPITLGPFTDEYGTFVSAFAPVLDRRTGEAVMVIGLDVLADEWNALVAASRLPPILAALILLLIVLVGASVIRWRGRLPADRQRRLRHLETGLVGALGLALTVVVTILILEAETRERRKIFNGQVNVHVEKAREAFFDVRSDLAALAAFCEGNQDLDRAEILAHVSAAAKSAAAQAFGWVPRVPASEKERFEAEVRREGVGDFAIWEANAQGERVPATGREEYYPLYCVTPMADDAPPMGCDQGSEPVRRAALEKAIRTGLPTASESVTLIYQTGRPQGILVFHPVFTEESPGQENDGAITRRDRKETRRDRKGAVLASIGNAGRLRGFAASAVRPQALLDRTLLQITDAEEHIGVSLVDVTAAERPTLLAVRCPDYADSQAEVVDDAYLRPSEWQSVNPLFVFGRAYLVVAHPTAAFYAAYPVRTAWLAGLTGLILTAVLTAFVGFLRNRQAAMEQQVRRHTAALREREATLRGITDSAQDAILMMDPQGCVSFWNPAAERILGYRADEAIGRNLHELLAPERYLGAHRQAFPEFQRTGRGQAVGRTLELHAVRKDGREITVALSLSAVQMGGGWHAVGVLRDDTERKHAEDALRLSKADLEQTNEQLRQAGELANRMAVQAETANRAKSEFLANMSHEIRTPMTAILGYLELVDEGCQRRCEFGRNALGEHIHTISRNANHLLQVINDVLDISKIEAGKMSVERMACSPHQLVAEVDSLVQVWAGAKGLTFKSEFVGAIPETIQTDPTRLRQVLLNLIGNAIKFTETGGVRLIGRLQSEGDQVVAQPPSAVDVAQPPSAVNPAQPLMQFDVVDSGIGLTEEQAGRLFHAFAQGDTSTTRRFGGTGLGLAISKHLAQLLGGDVTLVETRPGAGTRFRLTVATGPLAGVNLIDPDVRRGSPSPTVAAAGAIPARRDSRTSASSGAAPSNEPPALQGCRILLAEDGPDNQRLISFFLKKAGAEVTLAENGKIALDAALEADRTDHPFDVILMDMQMPVMDGYEATRQLRAKGYVRPIIALTAHAMEGDQEKCLRAGCDDYASKPVNRLKLLETTRRWVRAVPPTSPPLPTPPVLADSPV